MHRATLLAPDLSPGAAPLLECAAELRLSNVGHLVITHLVRMGCGQDPGDRGRHEIREWLWGQATRLRGPALHVTDLFKHAGAADDTAVTLVSSARQVDGLAVLKPEAIDATPALPLMARAAGRAVLLVPLAAG